MDELSLLEYEVILAELEYYTNLISMGSDYINESTGLVILTEDFKENIKNYIEKVIKSIQAAWDKFKNKIIQAPFKKYLEDIKSQVMKYDGTVSVEKFPSPNTNNFKQLNILPFTTDMLTKYKSKEDIIADTFSYIPKNEDNESFKNRCYNFINQGSISGNIGPAEIKILYTICTTGFPNLTEQLGNELKEFNDSIKNIQNNLGGGISNTGTEIAVRNNATQEMATIYESYLIEAEDNKTKINANGTSENPNLSKVITGLISINTDIISAKMSYLRNLYMWSIKLMRSLFKVNKDNNEGNKNIKSGSKDQIDI